MKVLVNEMRFYKSHARTLSSICNYALNNRKLSRKITAFVYNIFNIARFCCKSMCYKRRPENMSLGNGYCYPSGGRYTNYYESRE